MSTRPIPLELPTPVVPHDTPPSLRDHLTSLYTRLGDWTHKVALAQQSAFDALNVGTVTLSPAPDGVTTVFTASAIIRTANGTPQAILIEGTAPLPPGAWTLGLDGVTVTVSTPPATGTPFYFAFAVTR